MTLANLKINMENRDPHPYPHDSVGELLGAGRSWSELVGAGRSCSGQMRGSDEGSHLTSPSVGSAVLL